GMVVKNSRNATTKIENVMELLEYCMSTFIMSRSLIFKRIFAFILDNPSVVLIKPSAVLIKHWILPDPHMDGKTAIV
ncbi:MAG: hypothetical protein WBW34_09495, partial [Nitrososphaeraceae archaeon]